MRNKKRFNKKRKEKDEHRINHRIRGVQKVRLVGDNIEVGVYDIKEAMAIANDLDLDLVEINPKPNPPICKCMDYGKFLFDTKKKKKELEKKNKKTSLKEIKFGPNTEKNDISYRVEQAKKFLEKGNSVKCTISFRGREMAFKERGEKLLLEFAKDLIDFGTLERMPKMNGRKMDITIKPSK